MLGPAELGCPAIVPRRIAYVNVCWHRNYSDPPEQVAEPELTEREPSFEKPIAFIAGFHIPNPCTGRVRPLYGGEV